MIIGYGRSGSTLISRILGQAEGAFNTGEASRYLSNERMIARDLPCGCGATHHACPFWRQQQNGFSPEGKSQATRALRISKVLWGDTARRVQSIAAGLEPLRTETQRFFLQTASRADASVVIDASKHPVHAAFVAACFPGQVHALHLSRDPSRIIESYSTAKQYLPQRAALGVAFEWLRFNYVATKTKPLYASFHTLQYEDFLARPDQSLREIGAAVGLEIASLFRDGRTVSLDQQHPLAGNPDKLSPNSVTVRDRGETETDPLHRTLGGLASVSLRALLRSKTS